MTRDMRMTRDRRMKMFDGRSYPQAKQSFHILALLLVERA